jgi:hypothetical protein
VAAFYPGGRTVVAGGDDSFVPDYDSAYVAVLLIAAGPCAYGGRKLHEALIPFCPFSHIPFPRDFLDKYIISKGAGKGKKTK